MKINLTLTIYVFILGLMFAHATTTHAAESESTEAETTITFPAASDLWMRLAPPSAKMLAAYVTLQNNSEEDLTLVGAYAPDFGMAEIHKTTEVDGMLRMREQESLALSSGSELVMEPGGLHIMLMMPQRTFEAGEEARICLIYQDNEGQEHVQHLDFPVLRK